MFVDQKQLAGEYSCQVKERFSANGGKLFLVDYSKSCAVKVLADLLSQKDYSSLFCVVKNNKMAAEFEKVLKPILGEICIIDSVEAVNQYIKQGSSIDGEFTKKAKDLKKRCPWVIFVANCNNTSLLHYELCNNTSKNGMYNTAEHKTPYCVSDFIAQCRYEFIVIDDVYDLFAFEEENKFSDQKHDPALYDLINFNGVDYYADVNHSYKRLKNITGAAKKCVLISDMVVDKKVVNLFAALKLLFSEFSLLEARDFISRISYDYLDDCESLCTDISFCCDDENILSGCLHKTKGSMQKTPSDIYALKDHLYKSLSYMSTEEIFLRATYSYIKNSLKGVCSNLDVVLNRLSNGTQEMTNLFCDMFFADKVKGELESVVSSNHVCNLSEQEISYVLKVFFKYGAYHYYSQKKDSCNVLRIKRDDSGFEYFIRKNTEQRENDENTYSVLNYESALFYKSMLVGRLINCQEGASLKTPALVIANGNLLEVKDSLKKFLPTFSFTEDLNAVANSNVAEKTIVLTNYEDFRQTTLWLNVHSLILFDVNPDIALLKSLINKGLRYNNGKAYVVANYGDLSGQIVDNWQEEIVSDAIAMPIANGEMALKDGPLNEYSQIIYSLNELYSLLQETLTNVNKRNIKQIAEKYNKVLTDYTLKITVPSKDIENDFAYLIASAGAYNGVFQNSACVADEGEDVFAEEHVFAKSNKDDTIIERVKTERSRRLFFDVCVKMLHRTCDIKNKNCAACASYSKLNKNNFAEFKKNIDDFFKKTLLYIEALEHENLLVGNDDTIYGYGKKVSSAQSLVKEEIQVLANQVNKELKEINAIKKGITSLFSVDYQKVVNIKEAILKAYSKLLNKYYETIKDIFGQATQKAKFGYGAVSNGFSAAHKGL